MHLYYELMVGGSYHLPFLREMRGRLCYSSGAVERFSLIIAVSLGEQGYDTV